MQLWLFNDVEANFDVTQEETDGIMVGNIYPQD